MNREQAKIWCSLTPEQLITLGRTGYANHHVVMAQYAVGAEIELRYTGGPWLKVTPNGPDFVLYASYRVRPQTVEEAAIDHARENYTPCAYYPARDSFLEGAKWQKELDK